jgi:hypothetical protein
MDPQTIIRRSPRAVFRKLENDSGGVVLHLDSTAYHGVNETGALIWDAIDEGITFEELVNRMGQKVDDVPDTLSEDIAIFLSGLRERDLIVLEQSPDPADGHGSS